MKRILTFCCSLLLLSSSAFAGVAWDWNFSGAGGPANITNIDETQFLASSILGFKDAPGPGAGVISPGDLFFDFTAIRFTNAVNSGGNNVAPIDYGTGPGRTHEVTAAVQFSGFQIPGNQYIVSSVSGEFYADFNAAGAVTFTGSDFFDLETFIDSPLGAPGTAPVETFVLGGASGGTNSGPTAPDGTIDVIVSLTDNLSNLVQGEAWELNSVTGNPLDELVLRGAFDGNNFATPPATLLGGLVTGSVIGGNPVAFGFDMLFPGLTGTQLPNGVITSLSYGGMVFDFAFQTRSDGSFSKDFVPEPGSFAIFSMMGLSVIGMRRRRNRR